MACRRDFWRNSVRSLHVIHRYFEEITGKGFDEFRPMVFDNIHFETCDHRGALKPMYYTSGVPSSIWVCKVCSEGTL